MQLSKDQQQHMKEHQSLVETRKKLQQEARLATPDKIAAFKQELDTMYNGIKAEIRQQTLTTIAASEEVKKYEGEEVSWKQHLEAIKAPDNAPQITLDAIKQACKQKYKAKLAEAFTKLELTLGFVVRTNANTTAGEAQLGWHLFNDALQDQYERQSYDIFSWQLKLEPFLTAKAAYDGIDVVEHSKIRGLENKYRNALKAMETEMDAMVDSMVETITNQTNTQLESTEKDGYLDKVKKRRMILTGVTAALYAVELSLALAMIEPLSKGGEAIKQLIVVDDILHDRIRGFALKPALQSISSTAPWNWYIDSPWYIYNSTIPSWSLDRSLWRHLQGLWDKFYYEEAWPNISLSILALVGLTVAIVHTWQLMSKISHTKVDIAKEVMDAIEPAMEVQQKWRTAVAEDAQASLISTTSTTAEVYTAFADTSKGLEERLILLGTQLRKELEAMQGQRI